jgi:hypothetical protein
MKQNKFIWILIILIVGLIISLGFISFQKIILEKKLDNWGRLTNNLHLERDFEIYNAVNETSIEKIKNNLDLNFMFHLTAIETDGIKNVLDMQDIDRLCEKYNRINVQFKNEYEKKYPSSIKDLDLFCKLK